MVNLSWQYIQNHSDEILSDGIFNLSKKPINDFSQVDETNSGNYLITLQKKPFYIGEAKNIIQRIKQQSKPTTSTFYKTFQSLLKSNGFIQSVDIDNFKIQTIESKIGRKEIEEFGIVNLPTILNKFQLNKRDKIEIKDYKGLWENVQANFEKLLIEGENKILKSNFVYWDNLDVNPVAGLYIVKDKSNKIIYIGESSNLKDRIKTHSGRTYFSALRRHIGTEILGFNLQEINKKKRYFKEHEDSKVSEFLNSCKATVFPVSFGRYELEEYLIKKHKPLLNRKDNKKEN